MSKSRQYTINGEKVFFTFDKDSNLNGISVGAGRNGQYRETPIDPSSDKFKSLSTSEDALAALNVHKFKGKTTQTAMQIASTEELNKVYDDKTKKRTNEDLDVKPKDVTQSANISPNFGIGDPFSSYKRDPRKETYATVLAYPLDIDPQQDHLKISKFA